MNLILAMTLLASLCEVPYADLNAKGSLTRHAAGVVDGLPAIPDLDDMKDRCGGTLVIVKGDSRFVLADRTRFERKNLRPLYLQLAKMDGFSIIGPISPNPNFHGNAATPEEKRAVYRFWDIKDTGPN